MARDVLVHYHIFKNAGSSVDAAMVKSFGEGWATFEGRHPTDVQDVEQLRAFLESRPEVRAVSSHLARPPLPWPQCLPIVFLRHPVLRAKSVYEFTRADRTQPNSDVSRRRSFAGYVQWALDGGVGGIVIRDYQVVHLSDASFTKGGILAAEADAADLHEAKDLLSGWGVVGIVEDYAGSAARFQAAYGKRFPELRFDVIWANRTSSEQRIDRDDRLAAIREELGDALYERLAAANRLDLELYDHGRTIAGL
jgi:hypothetical protein